MNTAHHRACVVCGVADRRGEGGRRAELVAELHDLLDDHAGVGLGSDLRMQEAARHMPQEEQYCESFSHISTADTSVPRKSSDIRHSMISSCRLTCRSTGCTMDEAGVAAKLGRAEPPAAAAAAATPAAAAEEPAPLAADQAVAEEAALDVAAFTVPQYHTKSARSCQVVWNSRIATFKMQLA